METIESNKAFSTERFLALFKSDLTINKGNYIKHTIATLGVFAAVATLISINASMDISNLRHNAEVTGRIIDGVIASHQMNYGTMYLGISLWLLAIGMTVFGSLTFSNFSTKRQRISALMVPASQSEKFLLRVVIYLIGGSILLILGLLFGLAICEITFGGGKAPLNAAFDALDAKYSGCITLGSILTVLLGYSIYALGSAYWPKLSWIKTAVVITVVQWVGLTIFMILATAHINWNALTTLLMNLNDVDGRVFIWSGLAILMLLNLVCWGFAWVRFKNTQIIQRFMTK